MQFLFSTVKGQGLKSSEELSAELSVVPKKTMQLPHDSKAFLTPYSQQHTVYPQLALLSHVALSTCHQRLVAALTAEFA